MRGKIQSVLTTQKNQRAFRFAQTAARKKPHTLFAARAVSMQGAKFLLKRPKCWL
jgi:hypothetical protein